MGSEMCIRDSYTTYSGNNFEFRIGKQIHSWGSVDENSPLDNASAFDYYYIFFLGTERKMATMSAALDYYYGNFKTSVVFSPLHHTNRIPLGDDDFPITLPVYPQEDQIFPINKLPFEGLLSERIRSTKVDLPIPDFPIIEVILFFLILISNFSRTCCLPS